MQRSSLILNTGRRDAMQIRSFADAHNSGRARPWPPVRVSIKSGGMLTRSSMFFIPLSRSLSNREEGR